MTAKRGSRVRYVKIEEMMEDDVKYYGCERGCTELVQD